MLDDALADAYAPSARPADDPPAATTCWASGAVAPRSAARRRGGARRRAAARRAIRRCRARAARGRGGEHRALAGTRGRLARERDELFRRLEQTNLGIAAALAAALEAKDYYTADHAPLDRRPGASTSASKLGMTLSEVRDLRLGAILPRHRQDRRARRDPQQARQARPTRSTSSSRRHAVVGEQILAPVPFLDGVRRIVRHDHERWDGGGYPDGLRGEEIPLGSRIVFVVDVVPRHDVGPAVPAGDGRATRRSSSSRRAPDRSSTPAVVEAFVRVLGRRRRSPSAASRAAQRT